MIKINNLCKTFGEGTSVEVKALRGINLNVNKGEMVSIMGPSGSGKSTLLHIIALIDNKYVGEYEFNGINVKSLTDTCASKIRNEEIGLIMQDYGLIGALSAQRNVELPLLIAGKSGKETRKKALNALNAVGLADKANYNTNVLSGGERQRVAIARAIVMDTKLILADEPTGALDSQTTIEIINLLKKLNEQGLTIVIVTHDIAVANMCKRQINITDGVVC